MCSYTGKNLKFLKPRTAVGAPRQPNHTNDTIELDFCGPLRSHYRDKHYILVAIDRFSKFVTTKLVDAPSTYNVLKFMKAYIATHSAPHTVISDQGSAFTSHEFKSFCSKHTNQQEFSPVNDHRGTGVVERAIRTIKTRILAINRHRKHLHLMISATMAQPAAQKSHNLNVVSSSLTGRMLLSKWNRKSWGYGTWTTRQQIHEVQTFLQNDCLNSTIEGTLANQPFSCIRLIRWGTQNHLNALSHKVSESLEKSWLKK